MSLEIAPMPVSRRSDRTV